MFVMTSPCFVITLQWFLMIMWCDGIVMFCIAIFFDTMPSHQSYIVLYLNKEKRLYKFGRISKQLDHTEIQETISSQSCSHVKAERKKENSMKLHHKNNCWCNIFLRNQPEWCTVQLQRTLIQYIHKRHDNSQNICNCHLQILSHTSNFETLNEPLWRQEMLNNT